MTISSSPGHGADVKCCDWHPRKSLLVSGSKDNQQPVKLWDCRSGQSVTTMSVKNSVVVVILCQLLFHFHLTSNTHYTVVLLTTMFSTCDVVRKCDSIIGY